MKERGIYIVIIVILLVVITAGVTYFLTSQGKNTTEQPALLSTTTTVLPQAQEEATTTTKEENNIPQGWQTYKNTGYGFAVSYPSVYNALDDENNLYGWPKGIVLFHGGGQSYDLAIEAWDTVSEYENKYQTQMDNLTVKQVGNKYITLLNTNQKAEIDQIISTFEVLE